MTSGEESKTMPSLYEIFEHWKDLKLNSQSVVKVHHSPACWACGVKVGVKLSSAPGNKDSHHQHQADFNYQKLWNSASNLLERCHIVPKSLGGNNAPDNLFLLCKSCHSKSPDTDCRDLFLNWVLLQRQNFIAGFDMLEAKAICDYFDIEFNDFLSYMTATHPKDLGVRLAPQDGRLSSSSLMFSYAKSFLDSMHLSFVAVVNLE